ncbi:MAG: hypothetical protein JJE04_19745 [Acidobacteriia bacterium]|nr:hypothetical protein [Terriglobia bacterium]
MSNQTAPAASTQLAHVDCNRLASTLVLSSECRADFDGLSESVLDRWQPASPVENFFAETLIVDLWHLHRVNRMKIRLLEMVFHDANLSREDLPVAENADSSLDQLITSNPKSRFGEALRQLRLVERKLIQSSGHVERQMSLLQAERWMGASPPNDQVVD